MKHNGLCIAIFAAAMMESGCQSATAPRPALVSHMVFVALNDPADADALIADCDALLSQIPGVVSYACGQHIDTGRPSVDANYDVGLYIGFDSLEDYAVYVDHPDHVELVEKWKASFASMMVRDVWDDTE